MYRLLLAVVCCVTTVIGSTAALANDPNEKAIKARRGEMQMRSFYAGPLFGMAKGKVEYNAETAQTMADNLAGLAKLNNGAMWPQGSDIGAYKGKTRIFSR